MQRVLIALLLGFIAGCAHHDVRCDHNLHPINSTANPGVIP